MSDAEENLREALERIEQWSYAYPEDIFLEPDWKKARELLEAGGMTLDGVCGSAMRRATKGIGKIARDALRTNDGTRPTVHNG